MRDYQPLVAHPLGRHGPCTIAQPLTPHATLDSPARDVMTDLLRVPAASIQGAATLETANEHMIARGVRSLFVLTPDARVEGLITVTDVLGERAMRVAQVRGVRRTELLVRDVMTPLDAVVAFSMRDVAAAKVGHVVAALRQSGRHHALIAETTAEGWERIRGIFSAAEIGRQLGEPLQIPAVATTFAEVERALLGGE
jgi:CBS-domain-containing membrane protein